MSGASMADAPGPLPDELDKRELLASIKRGNSSAQLKPSHERESRAWIRCGISSAQP
jgi:hypothetical protein